MMRSNRQLVLIATSFPDPGSFESNFLEPELPHLLGRFESVHLLPCKHATAPLPPLPKRAHLHHELAEALGFPRKLKLLQHAFKGRQVGSQFPSGVPEPAMPSIRALANYANLGMAWITHRVIEAGLRDGTWDIEHTVFYSYWCKYTALGIAWSKRIHPNLKAIARAHRGDLYEAHAPYGLITRHAEILSGLDRVYAISEDGAQHLRSRFPAIETPIEIARLGTSGTSRRNRPSTDETLRLVSCSRATPVKRLELIAECIFKLAAGRSAPVEWIHFGDGPTLAQTQKLCAVNPPNNLSCIFRGNQPLENILEHYANAPCDVFVNASRSEGIPVSMMEAMSAGIPCVAPRVGGIPELLGEDSGGVLVSENPSAEELAQAIERICESPEIWERRSEQAFSKWAAKYDANGNFAAFADSLAKL